MGKRRVEEDSDIDVSSTDSETELEVQENGQEGESGQNAEEEDIVNVDFDYFDLNPNVDFHATKTFITQLMGDDSSEIDVSGLADLILAQNSVGTTIKTEGQESDPFAMLTVLNINEHATKAPIKKLTDYVLGKSKKQTEFNLVLRKLLGKDGKVGLIFSERMINMPVEVVPPMYKMLLEEMEKADEAHEKYEFDYFLIISKVYKLVAAKEEEGQKSKKKKNSEPQEQMDYFHYEDIILEQNSKYHGVFDFTNEKQDTDSRRVFTEYGIDPKLSLILIEKDQLAKSVPEMELKFPPF